MNNKQYDSCWLVERSFANRSDKTHNVQYVECRQGIFRARETTAHLRRRFESRDRSRLRIGTTLWQRRADSGAEDCARVRTPRRH